MNPGRLHAAAGPQLSARELHDLLALRIDVFVVEQDCPYREIDGQDLHPGTEHLWFADDNGVTATVRILTEADGLRRIGRVTTRRDRRSEGLAGRLMQAAIERVSPATVVLAAQSHLAAWYQRFGFAVEGAEFLEDGIPHVPMRRPAGAGSRGS
ncbi:MAG: GNAT family N-acetyltransferase [Planctomycetota bacterium]